MSAGTLPVTASSSSAASSALRASGPRTVSPWKASASGQVEIRPRCGFSPTRPHQAAGMRIEPAPSEPIAPATRPAATAAAAPPLEPPGAWPSCQGLRVAPKVGDSVKCHWPTSGAWVLPTMIAPARLRRRTSSASVRHSATSPPQPNGVEWPARSTSSLIAIGTPRSGAFSPPSPPRRRASARSASSGALSAQTTRKAFRRGWDSSIRASESSTSSREETSRQGSRRAWSASPVKASSGAVAASGNGGTATPGLPASGVAVVSVACPKFAIRRQRY